MKTKANNELIPMTRRYPKLKEKQHLRDGKIAKHIVHYWDHEGDTNKVFQYFVDKRHLLSDYRYWEILRTVWIVCGSIEKADTFRLLMTNKRKHKYYFSTPEESELLASLPETLTIYRATNNMNDKGLSWTLDETYAEKYKEMFNKSMIIRKEINKSDVFAYINRNNEFEIILL